jgi:hypothetical protein
VLATFRRKNERWVACNSEVEPRVGARVFSLRDGIQEK